MGNVPAQVANQCCCEKAAVYNVQKGSWASPFQSTAEYAAVSEIFSKSAAAAPRGETPTIVLVGGTGVGKSNLGNYLLGRSAFESRNSQESVTAVSAWNDGTWFGGRHPVRVVDCTGIGDTKGARADQKQWDTTIEVLKQVGKVSALVMVMRAGRFTKFDKEVISTLRDSFGPSFWKNMCVFCTGATAKPGQLNLEIEGPKIRKKLRQIEQEHGAEESALQAIQRMHVYAADLDPVLCSPESRTLEFKFKPALSGLGLEELLALDLRIPQNVMEMSGEEFRRFAAADAAIERWIEGNYFTLGLSRLAEFKSNVMSMEPFTVAGLSRLADAPEEEVQPPQQETPSALDFNGAGHAQTDHLQYFTALQSLEQALLGGQVVLVKASWLEKVANQRKALPRRQELPSEATWDSALLVRELGGGGTSDKPTPLIVSISYCWLSKKHPDPQGFHLQTLAPLLKAFASWNRMRTDNIAVFIDWCCLHQAPRSNADHYAWEQAMQSVHLWYAHAVTSVWMLTRVPTGAESYGTRGWPYFEKAVGTMVNPGDPVLDIGMLRPSWSTWGQVLQDCRVKPMPPQSPEIFATELDRKNFTERQDREILVRRYMEVFHATVTSAEKLPYAGLRWGDREAGRVAKLLPLCSCVRELDLANNDIGKKGGAALASSISGCKELERLCLTGNCLDVEVQDQLRKAWMQAGKQEEGLDLGDQRPPMAPMEIVTTPSAVTHQLTSASVPSASPMMRDPSTPGRSPTRRSADELAALQMAELGARQAAFEARLHVAINRISSTLSEVGDAVGSTPMGGASPSGGPVGQGMLGSRAGSPTASHTRSDFFS